MSSKCIRDTVNKVKAKYQESDPYRLAAAMHFLTIRKYHYHGHASSPCVTATHFVRSSRSIPLLQCNVSTFPHIHSYQRAGTSWRIYLVAPHILTSCMQKIFSCQGTGCIRSNQRMERDNANRLLCNFKSQYLCDQLCF